MVKIRLMRVGKKKQPSYRLVVADARSARDGRIIESIGHYHPRQEPSQISVDGDRAVYWLRQGAQPSGAAKKLLTISGAWAEFSGEAPPQAPQTAPASQRRQVRATPAASVSEEPAELPEAEDQQEAAPEAEVEPEEERS